MKKTWLVCLILAACFPFIAQATPPDPPRTSVGGKDATLSHPLPAGYAQVQNSSVTVNITPPQTCFPGSKTVTQTATCPTGELAWNSTGRTFQQTATRTTTCPSGLAGTPTVTTSAWSPTVASHCYAAPIITNPHITVQVCSALATSISSVQCGYAPTNGSFTATLTWNGQVKNVSITCANPDRTDMCYTQTSVTVGGVSVSLNMEASGLFRADVYCPPRTTCNGAKASGRVIVGF